MNRNNRDAALFQCALLVGHESNEWRDNDRRLLKNHRWNLVDQRFAEASRQRHEGVASVENGQHRRFLLGPQALDAEGATRGLTAGGEQAHVGVIGSLHGQPLVDS